MKNIGINDVEDYINSNGGVKLNEQLCRLLAAVNDWPSHISSLEDYEQEVRFFIKKSVTKTNIQNYLTKIDYKKHAWQGESLSILSEVFFDDIEYASLEEFISTLHRQIYHD